MIFIFQCPNCNGAVKADSAHGGDIAVCPHCDATLMVPMDAVGSGTLVGGYRLQERLGSGGMGTVYLAEQISLKRQVALKVLPPAITRSEKFVQRFQQEVKMHGQLTHPCIAMAYDAGNDRGIHYLAMEYVKGQDVGRLILKRKVLPEREALRIALAVVEGLSYAWERKRIIHCDIKPGNIMVLDDGSVKILDMGLSKSLVDMADLTQTGYMVGTPLYMSPEQADSHAAIDFRSDMYSLGSTLYHMVTGVTPYQGRNVTEVITKKNAGDPPAAAAMWREVSEPCSRLIAKMMARRPEDRFASHADLLRAMQQAMEGRMPDACRGSNTLNRSLWIAAALILALTGAGVARKLIHRPPAPGGGGGEGPAPPPVVTPDPRASIRDDFTFALERALGNPGEPQVHLETFSDVRRRAEEAGLFEIARRAAEEEAKFRNLIDHEVNQILSGLRNRADEQASEGNISGAQEIVLGYEGPLQRESEARRAEMWKSIETGILERQRRREEQALASAKSLFDGLLAARKLDAADEVIASLRRTGRPEAEDARLSLVAALEIRLAAARAAAQRENEAARQEFEKTVGQVAAKVLALDLRAAETAARNAPAGEDRDRLVADLALITSTASTIMESFVRDVGNEIDLWLASGPVAVRIQEVRDTDLVAVRMAPDGPSNLVVRMKDLSPAEQVRRLVLVRGEREAAISCGLLAWAAGNPRTAAGYFEKARTSLGATLAEQAQKPPPANGTQPPPRKDTP